MVLLHIPQFGEMPVPRFLCWFSRVHAPDLRSEPSGVKIPMANVTWYSNISRVLAWYIFEYSDV